MDTKPVTELKGFALPANLQSPCSSPTGLPDGALSAGAVERLWAQDRAELSECGSKHKAILDLYHQRDAGLAGAKE